MISIHTNLSSIIAQESLKGSTNKLNLAVERMSSGYKINHAKDNAANYSIATNMTTKLNAYQVAEDNVAAGMDLVATASDTLSMMQDKASRLHALSTQARNGTYGAQSLNAINSEANAIMAEITRLYMTSQYNGIDLFSQKDYTIASHLPQPVNQNARAVATPMPEAKAEYNGFIDNPFTYTEAEVALMDKLSEVDELTETISGGTYSITSVAELEQLARMVNEGKVSDGEFVLGADLDLSSIENWTPIGDDWDIRFQGTFDGNGHVIKNLTINRPTEDLQGLFGYSEGEIKNVGVVDVNIAGYSRVGGLVGCSDNIITNCYATGNVLGDDSVGGLIGEAYGDVINNYAISNVTGKNYIGGLAGWSENIINCYSIGDVLGGDSIGGLVGEVCNITNSFATGNVKGVFQVAGLAGCSENVTNCYATGDVSGEYPVGGLVADGYYITNCYATGNVTGVECVGGLAASVSEITNSYATGNVQGKKNVGGLVGDNYENIINSYATGNVTGESYVGGLVGRMYAGYNSRTIQNSVSYSKVKGADTATTGSFIGGVVNTDNNTRFGTLDIINCESRAQDMSMIGGVYKSDGTVSPQNDMTAMLAGISEVATKDISTNLQVGINSDSSSQINFNTNFDFNFSLGSGIDSLETLESINNFIDLLSEKQTQLGAVQNRLESAIDSITVNIQNLASSRSTIRDADMAKLSSTYIQQQILQEASATLLATANQSPAIALQLI